MTLPNHVLAGSLIALAIREPLVAIPLAVASHFVMDALPHFGYPGNHGYVEALKHKLSYGVGVVSIFATIGVAILLTSQSLWLALVCGFAAALPDGLGIYNYIRYEKYDRKATGLLKAIHIRFHRAIQWCERPWGIYVEVVTFCLLTFVLIKNVY